MLFVCKMYIKFDRKKNCLAYFIICYSIPHMYYLTWTWKWKGQHYVVVLHEMNSIFIKLNFPVALLLIKKTLMTDLLKVVG